MSISRRTTPRSFSTSRGGREERNTASASISHSQRGRLARQIDVVNRPVKGSVGVDRSSSRLHLPADLRARALLGTLEDHVFQKMREPGTEEPVFVNAPGPHPELRRDQLVAVVLLAQNGETVRQHHPIDLLVKKPLEQWGKPSIDSILPLRLHLSQFPFSGRSLSSFPRCGRNGSAKASWKSYPPLKSSR